MPVSAIVSPPLSRVVRTRRLMRSPFLFADPMLRIGEPAGAGANQPSGGDEISDDGPLDRPAEPLPHLVLMREHRRTHPDERELGERRLLGRAPRLVPRLIPAAELAGVFVAALSVGDLDVARDHGSD